MKSRLVACVLVFAMAFTLVSCGGADKTNVNTTLTESDAEADEIIASSDGSEKNNNDNKEPAGSETQEIPTMEDQLLLDITEATVTASNMEYTPGGSLTMDVIIQNKLHDETLNAAVYLSSMMMFTDYDFWSTRYYPDTNGGDIIVKVELTDEAINGPGKPMDLSTIDINLSLYKKVIKNEGEEETEEEIQLVSSNFPVYTSLYGPISRPNPVFNEQILADTEAKKVTFTGDTNVSTSGFLSAKLLIENKSDESITTEVYIEKVNGYSVGDSIGENDNPRDRREITVVPGESSEYVLNADISSLLSLGMDSIGSIDICISGQSFFDIESFTLMSNSPISDSISFDGDETILHKDDSITVSAYTQKNNLILLLDNTTDGDYNVEFKDFFANGIELYMVAYYLKGVDTTNMGGSGFRLKAVGGSKYIQVIPLDDALLEYNTSPGHTDGDIEFSFTIKGISVDQDSIIGEWTTEFEEETSVTIEQGLLD